MRSPGASSVVRGGVRHPEEVKDRRSVSVGRALLPVRALLPIRDGQTCPSYELLVEVEVSQRRRAAFEAVADGGHGDLSKLTKLVSGGVGLSAGGRLVCGQLFQHVDCADLNRLVSILWFAAGGTDQPPLRDPVRKVGSISQRPIADKTGVKFGKQAHFSQQNEFKPRQSQSGIDVGRQPREGLDADVVQSRVRVVFFGQPVEQFGQVIAAVQRRKAACRRGKTGKELGFGQDVQAGRRLAEEHYPTLGKQVKTGFEGRAQPLGPLGNDADFAEVAREQRHHPTGFTPVDQANDEGGGFFLRHETRIDTGLPGYAKFILSAKFICCSNRGSFHMAAFENPFRPGAGHMPPYLAGREAEKTEFQKLLGQHIILENLVLTGLRGVGKTVLLETFKPAAIREGWLWVGTDMSESSSITEERLAIRMMADLAVVTSSLVIREEHIAGVGFLAEDRQRSITLDYRTMVDIFHNTPGLALDKLKVVLQIVWKCLSRDRESRGIIFAYDESQNLADHSKKDEYPLSLMLDAFQSLQKQDVPFMLALAGLPTLLTKLVEARTFAERMFHVIFLDRLSREASREAIVKPIEEANCPISLDEESIEKIIEFSGGYPYFVQFICREVFDALLQKVDQGRHPTVPIREITRKLDSDFFAGRWGRATDRQRDLLIVIAQLANSDREFTVQEIVEKSRESDSKPFSSSHVNQMLNALGNAGLVYKNRHGKYSFAVPLLGRFIMRQFEDMQDSPTETVLRCLIRWCPIHCPIHNCSTTFRRRSRTHQR